MARSDSLDSDSSIKRKRTSMDDRWASPSDRRFVSSTPPSPSPPPNPHRRYWDRNGDLEWTSAEGISFRLVAEKLLRALPLLSRAEVAQPGVAAARLRHLPTRTCEIILDLVYCPVDEAQLSPACESLGALAFCKRNGGEHLVDLLRPWVLQGTLAEETGHFAIWSYALGDEFKELELMRTGAFASLRIADLTSNSGLAKGYFDRRPVTPAALIALTRLHVNRMNAAQLLLTSSTSLPTPSSHLSCPSFTDLRNVWTKTLLALRQTVSPDFTLRVLRGHPSLAPGDQDECTECHEALERAISGMEDKWEKVPDGMELEPVWW